MNARIGLPHRYRSICAATTSNGYLRLISNSQTLTMSRFNNITINWMSTRHKFSAVNLIRSFNYPSRVRRCILPIIFFSPFHRTVTPTVITFYTNLPADVNDFQSLYTQRPCTRSINSKI